jgi:uncharacterized membrane protein HdeD (DUF308 family)
MPELPAVISQGVPTRSIIWSIVLIIFGFFALASPVATSFGAALAIGWLIFITGLVQLVHAFQSKGIGHIVWKVVGAVFYLLAGVYMIARPGLGLAGLTLALAIFFVAAGVVEIMGWFSSRKSGGSAWLLLNGIIGLVLGLTIWSRWPATSLWFLGTLVGISILMAGMSRLMMALAIRKFIRDAADRPVHERRAA